MLAEPNSWFLAVTASNGRTGYDSLYPVAKIILPNPRIQLPSFLHRRLYREFRKWGFVALASLLPTMSVMVDSPVWETVSRRQGRRAEICPAGVRMPCSIEVIYQSWICTLLKSALSLIAEKRLKADHISPTRSLRSNTRI